MEKCEVLKNKLKTKIKDIPSMFVESSCKPEVSQWSVISMEILKSSCGGELCRHEFQDENISAASGQLGDEEASQQEGDG